jgi:hypothetical protein
MCQNAPINGDTAKQYNLLWRYSEELKKINKENTCKININKIGSSPQPRFGIFYFYLYGIKKKFISTYGSFIGVDGCHLKTTDTKSQHFLNSSRRQRLKPTNFKPSKTYLQQKNTRTKIKKSQTQKKEKNLSQHLIQPETNLKYPNS